MATDPEADPIVEPVPDAPAAVATADGERCLLVADYHAGVEADLRRQGLEMDDGASDRRERLLALLDRTDADRLVILGDLGHDIGESRGPEREEIERLLAAVPVPVTLAKGNHDGDVEAVLADLDAGESSPDGDGPPEVTVTPTDGARIGDLGVVHGHTWPSRDVLAADVVCVGHEHPVVRLEDDVGGTRVERAWLRGDLDPVTFEAHYDEDLPIDGEIVVVPAFNDLSSGTWVNVAGQEFLSPFLPQGLAGGEAYLLDGTRLGPYDLV